MDRYQLHELINAFRQETQEDSITPDSLGALLEKIAEVAGDAPWDKLTALENNTLTLKNNVDAMELAAVSSVEKIFLQAEGDTLKVKGNIPIFIAAGLVPYIFRYSTKRNRIRKNKLQPRRWGVRQRGWHPFFVNGKIQVSYEGVVSFRKHANGKVSGSFFTNPENLFKTPNYKDGKIFVSYGKYQYNVKDKGKRFLFGIAFGLPTAEKRKFSFDKLKTNIATIHVNVYYDKEEEVLCFKWSR